MALNIYYPLKQTGLIITFIFASNSLLYSQISFNLDALVDKPAIQIGPRVSLQYSSVVAHDDISGFTYRSPSKPIATAGVFWYQRIGIFYLQGDALFTPINVNVKLDGLSSDLKFRTFNLDLPVVAGIAINGKIKIHGGLLFTQLLSASYSDAFIEKADIEQNLTKSTLGYTAGIGFNIKKLVIDIRYGAAITKLTNGLTISRQTLENENNKNQMITLSIGYDLLNNGFNF